MYVKYLTSETRQQLTTLLCRYRAEELGADRVRKRSAGADSGKDQGIRGRQAD